jgi:hypothetical protein
MKLAFAHVIYNLSAFERILTNCAFIYRFCNKKFQHCYMGCESHFEYSMNVNY